MKNISEAKLETIFIAWCEAIEKPNGTGIFPFDAFKEGFDAGRVVGLNEAQPTQCHCEKPTAISKDVCGVCGGDLH